MNYYFAPSLGVFEGTIKCIHFLLTIWWVNKMHQVANLNLFRHRIGRGLFPVLDTSSLYHWGVHTVAKLLFMPRFPLFSRLTNSKLLQQTPAPNPPHTAYFTCPLPTLKINKYLVLASSKNTFRCLFLNRQKTQQTKKMCSAVTQSVTSLDGNSF